MMATEFIVPNKKLKYTTGNGVDAHHGIRCCEFRPLVGHNTSVMMNDLSKRSDQWSRFHSAEDIKNLVANCLKSESALQSCNKHPTQFIKGQRETRHKMDRSRIVECSTLLKDLMSHPACWVFNKPVDPVALNIPDYFSIISKPMDLGTVKSKLDEHVYPTIDKFASDVRLTFSNAMLYNPPENRVHKMAKELNKVFERRWGILVDKQNKSLKIGLGKPIGGQMRDLDRTGKCNKAFISRNSSLPKKSTPSEEQARKPSLVACRSVTEKKAQGLVSGVCGVCGRITCQCTFSNKSASISSDLSSERSLMKNRPNRTDASRRLDSQEKILSTSQILKANSDSDGFFSASDDENKRFIHQHSPMTGTTSREGWSTPVYDIQLSPKRALRAAMLKSRFAETILKAQQKILLNHGDKVDPVKMKQEKEKLERRQLEEKVHIETQIRAAEAASRKRADEERKQKRQRERDAARAALEKMEKTVAFESNLEILEELDKLSGYSLFIRPISRRTGKVPLRNPLEQLGLFLKDEFWDDGTLEPRG